MRCSRLPFTAADLGSVASGYLTRLYTRLFGCSRVNSVVANSVTGAFLMISLAVVAVTRDPYITIVLISIGGFGHQIISCMLSATVVESFDKGQMATVNGMRGSAAWIASFLFSLLIGVTADKIGFNPLFIAMGFFDLLGAVFWWHLLLNVAPSAPDSGCIAYENPEKLDRRYAVGESSGTAGG